MDVCQEENHKKIPSGMNAQVLRKMSVSPWRAAWMSTCIRCWISVQLSRGFQRLLVISTDPRMSSVVVSIRNNQEE